MVTSKSMLFGERLVYYHLACSIKNRKENLEFFLRIGKGKQIIMIEETDTEKKKFLMGDKSCRYNY